MNYDCARTCWSLFHKWELIYSFLTQCSSLNILKYATTFAWFTDQNTQMCTQVLSLSGGVPELGTMRCPPWELMEPSAVQDGSRERSNVWVCVRRPIVQSLLSRRQCGTFGDSLEENSPPRSSCGVTKPEELYTLIFRLGRGSSRGELVIGILSATSWRAYTGPRYMAAAEVRSGGDVRRSAGKEKKSRCLEWSDVVIAYSFQLESNQLKPI